ncbi:uncharacterized protein FA14DRAFT_178937 [Meira miltonrushii]|uniref:Zinc-finger domain-containing protein n=1 Tax=Meira miltonrushii TaxID=1280837 RepID=A0A316VEQ7_9BASI|nr:uncharacterized protein FA14DRAFT_178937 [Meira miltonrushii]PWN35568.1 hypothetical protein FA14DRAFT_178937 [Meira miltonrushii]
MKQPILSFVKKSPIDVIDLATPSSSEDSDFRKSIRSSNRKAPRVVYENGTDLIKNKNGEGSSKGANSNIVEQSKQESSKSSSEGKSNNKKKESPVLCHHHRAACQGNVVQCTVVRPNGSRCPIQYCESSLEKHYNQSFGHISTRGIGNIYREGLDHVLKDNYVFACPSCTGTCKCYMCKMKENGHPKEALGKRDRENESHDSLLTKSKDAKKKKTAKKVMQPTILNGFARAVQSDGSVAYRQDASSSTDPRTPPTKKRKFLPALIEPKKAEQPRLEKIETRLPLPNVMERIWIYESLVRFDAIDMPKKAVLQKLDRFDDWSESQVHTMLVRLSCYLAEVKTLKQYPQPSHMRFRPLIKALQEADKDLTRGEAWEKAKELLEHKEVDLPELEDVELRPDQMASTADESFSSDADKSITPTETLLNSRATRSRRAANTAARERVKYFTSNDLHIDSDDEESEKGDDAMDYADALNDEDDEKPILRKSRRSARTVQQKEEDDQTRSDHRKALGLRDRSKRNSNANEPVEEKKAKIDSDSDDDEDVVFVEPEETKQEKTPLPPFEQRIAVLSGMIELVLQRTEIRAEVEEGARLVRERAKETRDREKELLKKQDEEIKELRKKQTGTLKTQEWREQMDEKSREHLIELIDIRVDLHVYTDANKPRTGPLGRDTDGNEYWHLSEFNEQFPADTTGHWAWSLLVMGKMSTIPTQALRRDSTDAMVEEDAKDGEESVPASDAPEKPVIYGTNYADEINKLINFVRYRCELKCYDEEKQLRKKEDDAYNTVDENDQKRMIKACSRERKTLMSMHDVQKRDVKQLCERLNNIKEYYQWHRWG